ncbi:MAG: hypothetical protein II278_00570, partial [Bacteroidaceae bacterium]|nr:hypothetical protein [Bacteroidaceae bacterium]
RIRLCKIERDRAALNLINRQKAELERLLSMNQAKLDMIHDLQTDLETAKAEAIKEFADRLKVTAYMQSTITGYQHHVVDVSDIDYLAEKMIEKE